MARETTRNNKKTAIPTIKKRRVHFSLPYRKMRFKPLHQCGEVLAVVHKGLSGKITPDEEISGKS